MIHFQKNRIPIVFPILALLSLSFIGITLYFNYPFFPFPSDELRGYDVVLTGSDWWNDDDPMVMNSPVHPASLWLMGQVIRLISLDWLQTYLFLTAVSLSGSALLLGLIVHEVTEDSFYTVSTAILFLASAWSQTYLHFYTYAPLASLFTTASLYCFVKYFVAPQGSMWYSLASGFLVGLFFLSSSSAKLLAGILFCAYLLLIFRSAGEKKTVHILLLAVGSAIPVIGLMPLYYTQLVKHLATNVNGGNAALFRAAYGYSPQTPFFSFFHLLGVYSPAMLAFLILSLFFAMLHWRELKEGVAGRFVLTLMSIVVVHGVVLDLLPFTKLGRSQFPLFPIAIIALTLLYSSSPRSKVVGKKLFFLFLLVSVAFDTITSLQTRQVKRAVSAKVYSLPAETIYFVLDEDPHGIFLQDSLGYGGKIRIHSIRRKDLVMAMDSIPRYTPVALLLGPMGPNSGKSILGHGMMADFYFALPADIAADSRYENWQLPYYGHYPPFLMEEENCQHLYFTKQVPGESTGQDRVTVYYWPPETS